MPKPFDPYHQWLGIHQSEQPPNHYRLLGIRLFEDDLNVIEHAADQRMTHLKSLQSGQHGSLVQTLLNKVSAARHCLLIKESREDYNKTLHEQFRRPEPIIAPPLPPGLHEPGTTKLDPIRQTKSIESTGEMPDGPESQQKEEFAGEEKRADLREQQIEQVQPRKMTRADELTERIIHIIIFVIMFFLSESFAKAYSLSYYTNIILLGFVGIGFIAMIILNIYRFAFSSIRQKENENMYGEADIRQPPTTPNESNKSIFTIFRCLWWVRSSMWFAIGMFSVIICILMVTDSRHFLLVIQTSASSTIFYAIPFAAWLAFRTRNATNWKTYYLFLPIGCGVISPFFTMLNFFPGSWFDAIFLIAGPPFLLAETCIALQVNKRITPFRSNFFYTQAVYQCTLWSFVVFKPATQLLAWFT